MRTTVWQIVKFAWVLYWHPGRYSLRLGQLFWETGPDAMWADPFYVENDELLSRMKATSKMLRRPRHGRN